MPDIGTLELITAYILNKLASPTLDQAGKDLAIGLQRLRDQKITNVKTIVTKVAETVQEKEVKTEAYKQLDLILEWTEGASKVDPEEEDLSSLWEQLLRNIVTGKNRNAFLLAALKKVDSDGARMLKRIAERPHWKKRFHVDLPKEAHAAADPLSIHDRACLEVLENLGFVRRTFRDLGRFSPGSWSLSILITLSASGCIVLAGREVFNTPGSMFVKVPLFQAIAAVTLMVYFSYVIAVMAWKAYRIQRSIRYYAPTALTDELITEINRTQKTTKKGG